MVGTLKIAGGVWEKSKNSRYPSGVALIVYLSCWQLLIVTDCPEIEGIWKSQTERKGRAKKREKQHWPATTFAVLRARADKERGKEQRGCKKWVFATNLKNSELSPKV